MSSGTNVSSQDEKSTLLDSDNQPNTKENVVGPPVVCGSNTGVVPPEVDRYGDDRIDTANLADNMDAQRNSEESGKHQMYLVAILMVMLIIVTMAFTQSLSPYMILNGDSSMAQKTLIYYMIAGLLVIFFLLGFYRRITLDVRHASGNGSTRVQKVNKILSNYLSVVGMSFFFPFACALDLCYIVAGTTCDAQWRTLSKLCTEQIYHKYWVDVFYHVTRIVFMGAELLFCLQFHKTRFTTNPLARLGLMLIMVVNIALWFESLIHETEDRDAVSEVKLKMVNAFCKISEVTGTESTNDTKQLQLCLNETSSIQKMSHDATSFLYPFTIEFSLLVGEFLAHKFFSCKDRSNENQHDPVETNEDRQDQLREGNGAQNNVENQRGSSTTYLPGSVLIVAIGVSANIAFITLAFFAHATNSQPDEKDMPNAVAFFHICSVFYYTLMLFFVILGFICGCKFEIRQRKIRGIDYLVLMSAFGPLMYGQIYVTAISRNMSRIGNTEPGKPQVIIADFVTNIVQLSLQAVFVFFADRVKPLTAEQRTENLLRHLHGAFKAVVFVMAIYNLTNWIIDSILLVNFSFKREFLDQIFEQDSWFFVDGILLPLSIFSRFNSFLLFTRAYLSEKA